MDVVDILGVAVGEGDWIAYSCRMGDASRMVVGQVVGLTEGGSLRLQPLIQTGYGSRPSRLRKPKTRCISPSLRRFIRIPDPKHAQKTPESLDTESTQAPEGPQDCGSESVGTEKPCDHVQGVFDFEA